jgi:GTPase SAR1 family protein
MGAVLSFCQKRKRCRVVILGIDEENKRTLYKYMTKGKEPQDGDANITEQRINIKGLSMLLCNVSGGEHFRTMWRYQVKHSDAIIFVIDTDNENDMETAKNELRKIVDQEIKSNGTSVLVLCNSDLKTNKSHLFNNEKIFEGEYLNVDSIRIQQCVLSDMTGVDEGINWMCERIGAG